MNYVILFVGRRGTPAGKAIRAIDLNTIRPSVHKYVCCDRCVFINNSFLLEYCNVMFPQCDNCENRYIADRILRRSTDPIGKRKCALQVAFHLLAAPRCQSGMYAARRSGQTR